MEKTISILLPFPQKQGDVLFRNVTAGLIFTPQPGGNQYFQPALKSTFIKKKEREREIRTFLSVQKYSIISKIAFNWKLTSRIKFPTTSRKFSSKYGFTVTLMPSTANYENKFKTFNLHSLKLKFSFGVPCQKQQSDSKLSNGLNFVLPLNLPRKDLSTK